MTKYNLVIQNRQTGEIISQEFLGDCTKEEANFCLSVCMCGCYDRHTEKMFIQEAEN